MTPQSLLNADMATLGQWARQGLAWWLDELAALLPASWRNGSSARPRIVAQRAGDGYRLCKDGRETVIAARPSKPLRAALALPPDTVLTRDLAYPRLPMRDVRRMVGLDIDRLTPFRAEEVHFDVAAAGPDSGEGARNLTLAAVTRAAADEAMAHALAWGLAPEQVGMAQGAALRFDFLPAMRVAAGIGSPERRRLYWWSAAAALLALNLAVLVGRDMAEVGALRRIVEAQRPSAEVALRLRNRVEGERARRQSLLERCAANEPLRVIAAATGALARDAWVQRLDWNGRAVRLAGFKTGAYDAQVALRGAPGFTAVRSLSVDAPAKLASGQPFDLAADMPARPFR